MGIRAHSLHVTNSLGRKRERFVPRDPERVGIYVCGPTVYSDAHLGHAKSYVSFDVIVRYLRHLGYQVKYVQNITDVGHLVDNAEEGEDKIERIARIDRVHPLEIAEAVTRGYFKDMEGLGIRHANLYPRATQHIPEQIELTERLIAKGHAYDATGNVYFSVASWPAYGALSGRQMEDQVEGTRVAVRSDKRDPRDFALWKRAEGGHIQRWKSPWGDGYPGWHVECSAMSMKYLGEEFDIHGGGLENQFPHHECEIAQSCAATGKGFARYWLHNNMIERDGRKMSKSLGNGILVRDLLKDWSAPVIRAFLLGTHYRSPANYTDDGIKGAGAGLNRVHEAWKTANEKAKSAASAPGTGDAALRAAREACDKAFHAAMDDDFNTPTALAAILELARQVNTAATSTAGPSAAEWTATATLLTELAGGVLGVLPEGEAGGAAAAADLDHVMQVLIDVRGILRDRKLFDLGDVLRNRLADAGIEVKDTKDGATWRKR
jgi:cysteinyl-tRNA synthetase